MSHFYSEIQGNRGEATRCGTKASGVRGHVRGWRIGCRTWVTHNASDGRDWVTVEITAGSAGGAKHVSLGTFALNDDGVIEKLGG